MFCQVANLCKPTLPVFALVLRYKLDLQRFTVCVLLYLGMYQWRLSCCSELFLLRSLLCPPLFFFLCASPALLSLWPYADDSSALACVHISVAREESTPFAGTDASLPKHDGPQMHQRTEYATVQTCNAAQGCAHTKTHAPAASLFPEPASAALTGAATERRAA